MTKLTLLLMLAVFATPGCGESNASVSKGRPGGMPAVQVVGYESQRRPVAESYSLVGTVEANESVDIVSEIDGMIEEILFKEGQTMSAGDPLVRLDQRKLNASLDQAKANLKLADSTLKRLQGLGSSGAVSKQEVEQALAAYESAKAQLALAEEQMADSTLSAPFDGVVGQRFVSPGQFIERGERITTLVNQDPMKAAFPVPERALSEVAIGQEIELKVVAYPSETFKGTVYFIDPQVDANTRSALVKAHVPNPEGKLRRGMFAGLELIVTVREQAIVIPETALMWSGEKASVFVADEENVARLKPVTLGVRLEGLVEIVEGLSESEIVIIEGIQKIGPGSPVSVTPASASPVQS